MKPTVAVDVHVILPKAALTAIFDECDRFDRDETGGRVIGEFVDDGGKLALRITGIIEAGPQAQHSPASFFQDGEYQEDVFRQIEQHQPNVEHLGNWHTHHVNGLLTLSNGDLATYHRTVNHRNHNTSFFYALLVTTKHRESDSLKRYSIRHFILRRGGQNLYEIPPQQIEIVDEPLVWPAKGQSTRLKDRPEIHNLRAQSERVYDRDIISEFYLGIRPYASTKLGFYWRGPLELLDGSRIQVVIVENSSSDKPTYSIVLRKAPTILKVHAEELAKLTLPSARAAIIVAERKCNRALYEHCRDTHKMQSST